MSKVLIALLGLSFIATSAFAQAPAVQAKPAGEQAAKAVEVKTFFGKVDVVSAADPAKGIKSEIVVANEAGVKSTFLVKSTTTIYDANASTITIEKIIKGDEVKVKYITTKEGVEEAMSVRVIK